MDNKQEISIEFKIKIYKMIRLYVHRMKTGGALYRCCFFVKPMLSFF